MIMMPAPRVARGLPSPPPEHDHLHPLAVHTVRRGEKKKKDNASPRRLPCVDAATATQRITSTHTRIPQCAPAPGVYAHACAGFSDNLTPVVIRRARAAGWIKNHRSVIIAKGGALCLAAPLPHATVPIGRHGVEVHLIKVFCVGQLAVRSELPPSAT